MAECQICGGRGEVEATPGQPGDGPMPCACQVPEWGEVEKATTAARYLQAEINLMRRVMQDAGTWDQFCADYAAYKDSGSAGGPPEGTPMADNTDPRSAVLREIAVDVVLADDLTVEQQRDALWAVVRRHAAIAKETL